ncbi:hypothetical protein EVAR_32623_1 [Eumeta japonica]|uniref:Uncharacterized protein n=1 Tax=Eumeta variegata TaxID=151549 RepID=A0A4C1WG66_EUMVA|nr:hypothetical protein EVAR_32623_1 [Eumeta japonica]
MRARRPVLSARGVNFTARGRRPHRRARTRDLRRPASIYRPRDVYLSVWFYPENVVLGTLFLTDPEIAENSIRLQLHAALSLHYPSTAPSLQSTIVYSIRVGISAMIRWRGAAPANSQPVSKIKNGPLTIPYACVRSITYVKV